jgi:c(7)-type cytochrome triheme protein
MNNYLNRVCLTALIALLVGAAGCKKEDFTLAFSHQKHVIDNEVECSVCHQATDGDMSMPGHEVCSQCHEIDETKPGAECLQCHKVKSASEIEAAEAKYPEREEARENDIIFSHKTHTYMNAKCETCHVRISRTTSMAQTQLPPLEACLACHNDVTARLEDCSVCHVPTSPINATHKLSWTTKHGIESKFGNNQCMVCHREDMCIACHNDQKPLDHNASWRIINHAAEAAWNRTRCMACHQEDFCERCHREAEPRSHKGGWATGPTRHCFICHFPISSAPCSTCHKAAPHPTAPASPHPPFTGFDCGECHPGSVPGRPPHPNPGIECTICHPRR